METTATTKYTFKQTETLNPDHPAYTYTVIVRNVDLRDPAPVLNTETIYTLIDIDFWLNHVVPNLTPAAIAAIDSSQHSGFWPVSLRLPAEHPLYTSAD